MCSIFEHINSHPNNRTHYMGERVQVHLNWDGQFVLDHPISEDYVFDSFEELVEAFPVAEEAKEFFFGEDVK